MSKYPIHPPSYFEDVPLEERICQQCRAAWWQAAHYPFSGFCSRECDELWRDLHSLESAKPEPKG